MTRAAETEPRWLDDREMRAWRAYIVGYQMLSYRLHRELQDQHGLALADYEILVRLSEQPGLRLRMSVLAGELASSKSRLSHHITRMEQAGMVRRTEYPSDGRGVFAELTEKGLEVLRTAAPTHLNGVRTHLIDLLTDEEQVVLASVFERVDQHLRGQRN